MHHCIAVRVVSPVFVIVLQLWIYSIINCPPEKPSPRMAQSRRQREALTSQLNSAHWHEITYLADRSTMMPSMAAAVTKTRAEEYLYLRG